MDQPDPHADPVFDSAAGFDEEDLKPPPLRWPSRRRVAMVLALPVLVLLLVVVPPLVNVNRYRRQITSSIALSLGRPVRVDSVALTMLPTPGFSLHTFIVEEDPAFGSEPVLRADAVRVSLRASSLWRRHVEFSKIVLTDPSVNLVRLPDGRWNLQSILMQAARMPAAPTGQKGAGQAPRFPYVEATGARVNFKMGVEKLPISLTDARFSLWLSKPDQYSLRLEAHPTRTNGSPADTGLLRVAATLGKAATLQSVPLDLSADWTGAPLGGVSALILGRDAGVRGEMTLHAAVRGTAGQAGTETELHLTQLRRADWVPEHPLDMDMRCTAQAADLFHRLTDVICALPPDAQGSGLVLNASVPDVLTPSTTTAQAAIKDVSAAVLLDALRVASRRTSSDLAASGTLAGDLRFADGVATGNLTVTKAHLLLNPADAMKPILTEANLQGAIAGRTLTIAPFPLQLGAAEPVMLSAILSQGGYELHLTGSALRSRLMQFAQALPVCGDGLDTALPPTPEQPTPVSVPVPEQPISFDLISSHTWGAAQVWTPVQPAAKPRRHRR